MLYLCRKHPTCPFKRSVGRLQSQAGCCWNREYLLLLLGITPQFKAKLDLMCLMNIPIINQLICAGKSYRAIDRKTHVLNTD
jgi:hypothetical protein